MLDRLPNEILYLILGQLSSDPPPSHILLNTPPSPDIVRAPTSPLKAFARVSPHFAELVRPLLFTHCWCNVAQIDEFLAFVARSALRRLITSIVVIADNDTPVNSRDGNLSSSWWCRLLEETDPLRLTLLAPPAIIGQATGTTIMDAHSWAFDVAFQTLSLEQGSQRIQSADKKPEQCHWPSLLHARDWNSITFNESSWLKAYNHYEYFRHRIPSILDAWGNSDNNNNFLRLQQQQQQQGSNVQDALANITHFRYTAVFPFYNHIRKVLHAVRTAMPNLQSFSAQLAPARDNHVIEQEQRGSMDPNDPWMELATGYSLIAHVVRDLGENGRMERLHVCDYEIEALRPNLSVVMGDVLDSARWEHDGFGTWIKKKDFSSI